MQSPFPLFSDWSEFGFKMNLRPQYYWNHWSFKMKPRLQLVLAVTESTKLMPATKKRPDGAACVFLSTWDLCTERAKKVAWFPIGHRRVSCNLGKTYEAGPVHFNSTLSLKIHLSAGWRCRLSTMVLPVVWATGSVSAYAAVHKGAKCDTMPLYLLLFISSLPWQNKWPLGCVNPRGSRRWFHTT